MIVISIDLYSARVPGLVTNLGKMILTNDGKHPAHPNKGNYDVRVGRKDDGLLKILEKPQRTGRVENYGRKAYSVWCLVKKALESAGY